MKHILLKFGLFLEYIILAAWFIVGLPLVIFVIMFSTAFSYPNTEIPISEYIICSTFWLSYYIPITIIFIQIIRLTQGYLYKNLISSKKIILSIKISLAFLIIETLVIYFLNNHPS